MAAISVRCPGCRRRLAAPPEASGRTLSCPNCRAPVTVAAEGNTVIDEAAPDFSYLREQAESDDDILVAEDADDGESALSQSTARRPAPPTVAAKLAPPAPAPVIYTPAPAAVPPADNPFADLSDHDSKARKKPAPPPAQPSDPPSKARRPPPEPAPVVRTPRWVWPVLIALAVYAAVATGGAAWGWLRPTPPDAPGKPAR